MSHVARDLLEAEGQLVGRLLRETGEANQAAARRAVKHMLAAFPPHVENRLRAFGLRGYDLGFLMLQMFYPEMFGNQLRLTRAAETRLTLIERTSDVVSPYAEIEMLAAEVAEEKSPRKNPEAAHARYTISVEVKSRHATKSDAEAMTAQIVEALVKSRHPAQVDLTLEPAPTKVQGVFGFDVFDAEQGIWLEPGIDPEVDRLYEIVDRAIGL